MATFELSISFEKLTGQVENVYLLHSKNDPVVPFEHLAMYASVLPNAKLITFDDKGHFHQESFPELTTLIKTWTAH